MSRFLRSSIIVILTVLGASGCGAVIVAGGATAASMVHDRRTTGTIVEDQSIELKASQALQAQEDRINNSHINITSYNNSVLLSGEVETEALRGWVEQTVASIEHVVRVHNELIVAPPSSLSSRSNDSWITAKVKSALFQIGGLPDFDPSRVKVVTERGITYLMGLVTPQEADAVTSVARRVSGVQQVVTLFEYL